MEIKAENQLELKNKIINIYNLNKKKNIYCVFNFDNYYNINNIC